MKRILTAGFFCSLLLSEPVFSFYTEDADLLLKKADDIRTSDQAQFREYLNNLMQQRTRLTLQQQEYLDYLRAFNLGYQGQNQESEQLFSALSENATNTNIRFRAAITLANIQIISRQFLPAFTNLMFGMSLFPEVNETEYQHNALITAAVIYSETGLYKESLNFLKQLNKDQLSPRNHCLFWHLKLKSDYHLNSNIANEDITEGEQICRNAQEIMLAHFILLQRAYKLSDQHQYQAAFELLQQQLPEAMQTRYPRVLAEYYYQLAASAFGLNKNKETKHYLTLLAQNSRDLHFSLPAVKGLKLAAELAASEQDYANAYQLHQEYMQAERSLSENNAEQLLSYQLAKGELFKKNQQLDLMHEQYRVLALESELKDQEVVRNQMLIMVLMMASLMLLYLAVKLLKGHRFYKAAAELDQLTQISNKYHFETLLTRQLSRCQQAKKPVGLIVFEIDQFKTLKSNASYIIAEQLLIATVDICRHFIRSEDIFGRINNEELAIALPECQEDKVVMLAEICQDAIAQLELQHIQPDLKITASFGVTSTAQSGYELYQLFKHAEQALYLAKRKGQNQLETYIALEQSESNAAKSSHVGLA